MNAALQRGDHAIVQFPAYQSHYSIAEALGVEITRWQCDLSAEGAPDVEELERLVRPQTRAIVLTTPNNPTGYAFDRAQMTRVVAVARKHGLMLLSDEVYRGTEREAERIPSVCDWYERGVSLGGLSKSHGLAGLRIGWSCTRDVELYERMAALKDYLSICNSALSEFLAELALRHDAALTKRVRDITTRNLALLDAFFARHSQPFAWRRPRAGTTAFPRYLGGSAEAFCARAVREAGVLLLPSTIFDAGDEHIRFGYGRADLPEALATLERFIDSAQVYRGVEP
jgi:aspartate/methionine/tyrosine aminotransferase